jgi:putative endonuclease
MSIVARLMYRLLVWKERQRASRMKGRVVTQRHGTEHLKTGERGETLAYWYLRQAGYIMVARNRRSRAGSGEVDLIGWDGPVLAFVEVKTRTSLEAGPPETAVSRGKQKRIAKAAQDYLRHLKQKPVNYRFDVASVAWNPEAGLQIRLIKDAFRA